MPNTDTDSGDFPDGGRAIIINTPCGYEVALIRTSRPKQQLKINAHNMFGDFVPDFMVNGEHLPSSEGARMITAALAKLFP